VSPTEAAAPLRWALLAAAAFGLRAALAVVTETHPIFPAYYYADARLTDAASWQAAQTGEFPEGTVGQRALLWAESKLYRLVGHRPLAPKLLGALAAAAGVALLARSLSAELGARAAAAFGFFLACWPSSVFFTSQNMKDPWVLLFAYGGLAGTASIFSGRARPGHVALAAACLGLAGLLRAYVLGVLALAVCAAAALALARRRRAETASCLALVAGGLLLFKLASLVVERAIPVRAVAVNLQTPLVPVTYDARLKRRYSPTSPRGIAEFRKIRQDADQSYAQVDGGRRVESQLFYDQKFDDWLDVAAFMPKAAFYALFMPLPGLYPIEGKIGRVLACAEDLALLLLAAAAVFALSRRHWTATSAILILVFAGMTAGSALFEFDMGSASRHRIMYLPLLLCFAFTLLPRSADERA
jgi:hypothetical protein